MIHENNFNMVAIESMTLSLVQFKTEWNGACQLLAMIFLDLEKSYSGMANFYTVDYENNNPINSRFGVSEVPTILFFKNGKIVDHVIGLIPKNGLISKIEGALSGTGD